MDTNMDVVSEDTSLEEFISKFPLHISDNNRNEIVKFSYKICSKTKLYSMIEKYSVGDAAIIDILKEKFPQYNINHIQVENIGKHYDQENPPKRRKIEMENYYMYFNVFFSYSEERKRNLGIR